MLYIYTYEPQNLQKYSPLKILLRGHVTLHLPLQAEQASSLSDASPPTDSALSTWHQKIVSIELPNNRRGFGFSVISDGNRGTLVHSILKGGIADKVSLK